LGQRSVTVVGRQTTEIVLRSDLVKLMVSSGYGREGLRFFLDGEEQVTPYEEYLPIGQHLVRLGNWEKTVQLRGGKAERVSLSVDEVGLLGREYGYKAPLSIELPVHFYRGEQTIWWRCGEGAWKSVAPGDAMQAQAEEQVARCVTGLLGTQTDPFQVVEFTLIDQRSNRLKAYSKYRISPYSTAGGRLYKGPGDPAIEWPPPHFRWLENDTGQVVALGLGLSASLIGCINAAAAILYSGPAGIIVASSFCGVGLITTRISSKPKLRRENRRRDRVRETLALEVEPVE
jgi:hypothetical protein